MSAPDPDARRTTALSLAKIAVPEAVDSLITGLADADPLVREYSAWGLGNVEPQVVSRARPRLASLLRDPVPSVAHAAAIALGRLGPDRDSIATLGEILRHGTPQEKQAVLLAFGEMEAAEAFPNLVETLRDHDPKVRHAAVAALGELGDRRAISVLAERLREDDDAGVRSEAAYRLGKLGDETTVRMLQAATQDANPSVQRWVHWAIAELTKPAEPR